MGIRFSIRDLLWLTLVVALIVGWWIDGRQWEATARVLFAAFFVLAAAFAVSLNAIDRIRRRESLFKWASMNGYRLLEFAQPKLTERPPWPLTISKSQHIFKINVVDLSGQERHGFVRVGGPWRGLSVADADVRWC